jgi:hypothetical protein
MSVGFPAADWLSADAYASLRRCDRHGFAWEWLRRSLAYRAAYNPADDDAGIANACRPFGLHCFEAPDIAWPAARPIWRRDVDDTVLLAVAGRTTVAGPIDLCALAAPMSCHADVSGEHWLFADRGRHVRIDILGGSLGQGPTGLEFRLAGFPNCHGQIAAVERLAALAQRGRWPARNPPPERRAGRWALILRIHDAIATGASHREIAEQVLGLADTPRWRIDAPSWRRRVQRLSESARQLAARDPLIWLSAPAPRP